MLLSFDNRHIYTHVRYHKYQHDHVPTYLFQVVNQTPFKQLWSLHTTIEETTMEPCVFIMMTQRKHSDYRAVSNEINHKISFFHLSLLWPM